jgi:hypothetical protein
MPAGPWMAAILVATILTAVPVKAGGDSAVTRVLIAGIPGTGKSMFTRWLVSRHGFVRCPAAEEPDDAFESEVLESLVHPRLVIDWGFPAFEPELTNSLAIVELLIEQGVRTWWFDGDRDAALECFLARGTVSKADWDRQLAGINENWTKIGPAFAGRILNVVFAGPAFMTNEKKFELVFPDGIAGQPD